MKAITVTCTHADEPEYNNTNTLLEGENLGALVGPTFAGLVSYAMNQSDYGSIDMTLDDRLESVKVSWKPFNP